MYLLFVVVWLSVPVQSIAWKDSSLQWPIMCRVELYTYTLTHSLAHTLLELFTALKVVLLSVINGSLYEWTYKCIIHVANYRT